LAAPENYLGETAKIIDRVLKNASILRSEEIGKQR
jgi:hypothetical protein